MHKLWPHSVKSPNKSSKQANPSVDDTTPQKEDNENPKNNTNNESTKESGAIQTQADGQKDSKTPMCLINELVKYNNVSVLKELIY